MMGVLDYFKPVLSMIDVRQPREYEMGHLAGARLIPVGELQRHVQEIDPAKLVITYWGSGVRSRAAAAMLFSLKSSRSLPD
jgi:rhodanese-related sulfurtransferase